MFKKIKFLLAVATSLCGVAASSLLTSCDKQEENKEIDVVSLKTALTYMNKYETFVLTLQAGSSAEYHDIIYTKNCMGIESRNNKTLTKIYYSDDQGTYEINYNGEALVGSEYRDSKNVWDTSLFPTFKGVGNKAIDKVNDADTSATISDKEYKILFAKILTGDASKMIAINSITASYSSNGLKFRISYDGYIFNYLAYNFGKATSYTVKEYVIDGGKSSLKLDYQLSYARKGIMSNNYKQSVYQYGEDEASTGYVMEYGYNEKYFIQKTYSSSYIYGYISLHAPEVTDGENPHPALEGIYYYYQDSTGFHLSSMAYNVSADLVEVMNYPCRLALWDNLHLLKEGVKGEMGGFVTSGKTYYVDDANILADASNNLMGSSSFEGQKPTGLVLDITTTSADVKTLTIYYQFKIGSYKYCYPFPFYSFGKVNNTTLNQIYNAYHTL